VSGFDFDLFVIGAGSGGVRAARMAATMGVRVAIAEEKHLGGTCVNVGCVPKKLFVYASQFAEEFTQAAGFGWQVNASDFDWPVLRDNKTREIERLNTVYHNLLVNSGCELIHGRAAITGPNEVEVEGRRYTAERILIAVGGWPHIPDFAGREHVISSNEAFYLEQFPRRALVVGSGYIGVEFAGIFNGLGAETTLVYRGEQILKGFDEEVRHFAAAEIAKKGVRLKPETEISAVEKQTDDSLLVRFKDGSTLETDLVMYATGRKPNVQGLGLEALGIECSAKGAIVVNEQFETSVASVYAIGDVIDRMQLTPVALAEGMALVKQLYGQQSQSVDYRLIPTAVFCQPPIGTVGLTEAQARAEYDQIEVYRSSFRAMKHTLSGSEERTLMKLLVDKVSRKVLGVHMVGADAGEIIQGIAIALKAGATKEVFDATIGIHPTAAEEFVTMREPVQD